MMTMTTYTKCAAILAACLMLAACEDKQAGAPDTVAASAPATVAESDLTKISNRLEGPVYGGVDAINGVVITPFAKEPVPVSGETVVVAGNFVDAARGEAAAGVVVMIDNNPFVATYGGERPDIAKVHNNPKFLKSQFFVEIPASAIGKGTHDVAVRGIASDRSGYFDSGIVAKIVLN